MKKKLLFGLLSIILYSTNVHALLTLRASYGAMLSEKIRFTNICQGSCTNSLNAPSDALPSHGIGGDAIIKLPAIPFGFGVRYESLGLSGKTNTIEAESKLTRTAAIINYRFIDTILHFGLIGTYGFSHSGSMTIRENNNLVMDLIPNKIETTSIGLELEVKPLIVVPLVIGAEGGYIQYKWNNTQNSVDSSYRDLDLSGPYLKVFLGFDI